jgi:hypothetical protein
MKIKHYVGLASAGLLAWTFAACSSQQPAAATGAENQAVAGSATGTGTKATPRHRAGPGSFSDPYNAQGSVGRRF